jgi:hypothetical protein
MPQCNPTQHNNKGKEEKKVKEYDKKYLFPYIILIIIKMFISITKMYDLCI